MKKLSLIFVCFVMSLSVMQPSLASPIAPELIKAKDAIGNANFSSAQNTIAAYIQANPRDPYGFLLRGILQDWQQIVTGQYTALNGKILADFDQARILAQVASDEDHNNLEKKIALGHALMYVSKKMIDQGQSFRAGGYLKRAKDIMTYVQLQDPNNREVDLPLGVFNYFSANVPKNLKWAASLLGFSGDAQLGLSQMQRASAYNNFSQFDAQYLYMYTLFKHEHNYAQAQAQNEILRKRYPANPEFEFVNAEIVYRKKDYKQALVVLQKFDEMCQINHCAKRYVFMSHYWQADAAKHLKDDVVLVQQIAQSLAADNGKEQSRIVDLHKLAIGLDEKSGNQKSICEHVHAIEALQKYNVTVWEAIQKEHPDCLMPQ